jgi:PPP family 3-phenylpropionic acid transporter
MIPKNEPLFISIIYIAAGGLMLSLQPILNAIAFRYSTYNSPINYGIARSFGSILYAILIISLGSLITSYGSIAIPTVGIAVLLLLLTALTVTESINKSNLKSQSIKQNRVHSNITHKKSSMISFLSGKKMLMIFSLGTLLIFFQNAVLNNYLYQIIKPIGGTELHMGRIFSFMAIMEIPGLLLFNRIRKKVKYQTLIKLSSVAFVLKIMLTYLAANVSFIFIAFAFQLFSFPIYIAASIHLMNEVLPQDETVKGQSLVTIMLPFSAIFANVVGGIILDTRGPSTLLLISTILCITGSIVIISIIDKVHIIYK